MFKNALVVGLGSIAKSVYIPELLKLGYFVDVLDPFMVDAVDYRFPHFIPDGTEFDVVIICTPNNTHLDYARQLTPFSKRILIEKPGVASESQWQELLDQFPDHHISLVKNNLFRDLEEVNLSELEKIEIHWLNDNRVPNPGGWFTNKKLAFGGVSHDLFPHLFCYLRRLIPFHKFTEPELMSEQRWDLSTVGSTDYGEINKNGVYDVCDYAEAHFVIEEVPITLRASWKEGIDDHAIHLYFKDGSTKTIELGICPSALYAEMIENDEQDTEFDLWIHRQLERFND